MPTQADLQVMRRAAVSLLIEPVTLHTVTRTLDRYGKATYGYPLASTVRGLLESTNGQERALLAAQADEGVLKTESARLKLAHGTGLTTAMVVRSQDGRYWDVAHVGGDSLAAFTVALLTLRVVADE